jgi:hypothetical protein
MNGIVAYMFSFLLFISFYLIFIIFIILLFFYGVERADNNSYRMHAKRNSLM